MLIILSPSKTMQPIGVEKIPEVTQPQFLKKASELVELMRPYTPKQLQELMGISPSLANLTAERFFTWSQPFTEGNSRTAISYFKGDVYGGLDAQSFTPNDLLFAHDHVRILSGLYGVIRPLDLIQPYRLEMGLKVDTGISKSLYDFWGKTITQNIDDELRRQNNAILVNLASQEYYKVIDSKLITSRIITPEFRERKGDSFKMIPIHAKRARGLMARYITKNRIIDSEPVKGFDYGGYVYREDLSSESKWVFVR